MTECAACVVGGLLAVAALFAAALARRWLVRIVDGGRPVYHCPNCGQPVPPNEWAAYRRHEDCAMRGLPCTTGSLPAAVRNGDAQAKYRREDRNAR